MRPVSLAQAWSAPVVVTLAGAACALYGALHRPEAYVVIACLVMLLAVPTLSTALIARGLVGVSSGARAAGVAAVLLGIALFVALVMAARGYEGPADSAPPASQW